MSIYTAIESPLPPTPHFVHILQLCPPVSSDQNHVSSWYFQPFPRAPWHLTPYHILTCQLLHVPSAQQLTANRTPSLPASTTRTRSASPTKEHSESPNCYKPPIRRASSLPSPSLRLSSQRQLLYRRCSTPSHLTSTPSGIAINMSKTVQISAAFSTISSRLDSFRRWPYQCWPPKQLAIHGFYKMPGEKGDPIACFSCGVEFYCKDSTMMITDKELLGYHRDGCLWADMRRETSSVITRPTNYSVITTPLLQEFETDSSPHRSSPFSSPLPTANRTSVETTSDLSSPTSADSQHTRSYNTPLLFQHPQRTSRKLISNQDTSTTRAPHFISEFSLSGLPTHSIFQLSVEGREISAKLRCDYCVNNVAKLDEPQMKKRKITHTDLAGRAGSKEE